MQDFKLTKHWFSSFQWGPLLEGMNGIFATLRPPITIFLMAGTLTSIALDMQSHFIDVYFHVYNINTHSLHLVLLIPFEQYRLGNKQTVFLKSPPQHTSE